MTEGSGNFVLSHHTTFCQNRELAAGQPQFAAEDFRVVLADQRRPLGDPRGRAIIDGCLAWIDEAAAELRVLDVFPEAAVMQVGIVEERLLLGVDRFVLVNAVLLAITKSPSMRARSVVRSSVIASAK